MENNKDLTTAPVEQTSDAIACRDCAEKYDCSTCYYLTTWQCNDYCNRYSQRIENSWKKNSLKKKHWFAR